MRLTAFTDYGLRALMRMATAPDRTFTTDEIATEFAISRNHLTKVVRDLAAHGFVNTQRGSGGGLRLARAPSEIVVGHVVRALEAKQALVECFRADGGRCLLTPKCRLKFQLAKAREAFLRELDAMTLAESLFPAPASAG